MLSNKSKLCILYAVVLLILSSCDDSLDTKEAMEEYEVPVIIPNGDEAYITGRSDLIFDQNQLYTFEIKLPTTALARLDANPANEIYEEGTLIFQGDTISPVGIRYKGSIGAFVGCTSGFFPLDPSGRKTCPKLSMKVKINWEGRAEKFYDLKKLQFHSMNQDDSQMRERLGYWLFRQMKLPAPRAVHSRLIINGEFIGVFALVEQIDGRFTRYNWDDGKGNLYKEIWPLDTDGNSQSASTFVNALKTNEDENPSVNLIQSFGNDIAEATDSELKDVIEKWTDINSFINYAAVDRSIKHDDGPFHWYCGGDGCSNHNYYWYEEPDAEKLHLIVWDLDNAFETHTDFNPVVSIPDKFGETRNDCKPFSSGFFGISQRSAACDKLTAGWAKFEEEFDAAKATFIAGPFSEESVNQQLSLWREQIRASTQEASDKYGNDAVSIVRWESAMENLKEQCRRGRAE